MSKNILIVEDDTFIARNIEAALAAAHYTPIWAKNSEEAKDALAKQAPDLVLLDIILPGENGFELLAYIKYEYPNAKVPVAIFSNLGSQEDIDKGMKLGAIAYFVKASLTPAEVVEKVKGLIGA